MQCSTTSTLDALIRVKELREGSVVHLNRPDDKPITLNQIVADFERLQYDMTLLRSYMN